MEWLEADPLPKVCQQCKEEDCYNCDHAGERWYLTRVDELELRRMGLLKAMERLRQQIAELEKEIQVAREESVQRARESWKRFIQQNNL